MRTCSIPLFSLVLFTSALSAQQYCLSGAVTSISNCNNCAYKIGDPVAVSFTTVPTSVNCNIVSGVGATCQADASFIADIGSHHYSSAYTPTPTGGKIAMGYEKLSLFTIGAIGASGSGYEDSTGTSRVGVLLTVTNMPTDPLTNDAFPASFPSPAATSATGAIRSFYGFDQQIATPYFSYTGQTCPRMDSSSSAVSIQSGGIVPIYSSSTTIQSGSWISIFGSNLSTTTSTWAGDFPTSLGNTTVTINGKPAYLWYVSPTQINLQTPDDAMTGNVTVTITNPTGSTSATATLAPMSPSFSVLDGKHVAGIILRSDKSGAYGGGTYDILGPSGSSLGYKTTAAKAGDTIELFGVGFGPTNPIVQAGKAYSGAAPATFPVQITIGSTPVNPTFAGITSAGLYQINLVVPSGLSSGDLSLLGSVNGLKTQMNVVLSMQ